MNGYQYSTVRSIREIGMGARVCLDLVDWLEMDEGLFVGNTGHGYVLLLGETRRTATYPPRPFRINCGALHQYVWVGDKTVYASEFVPGDGIQVYSPRGSRSIAIGRVKIEHRPLLRIELESEEGMVSATLQASESVHVMCADGAAKHVKELTPGDQVLTKPDRPGRHLGNVIEDMIAEY